MRNWFYCVTALGCSALSIGAEVIVSARLIPQAILPGTSAGVVVTLKNDSSNPQAVPTSVAMRVSKPGAESFLAVSGSTTDSTPYVPIPIEFLSPGEDDVRPRSFEVAPGATVEFEIPLNQSEFFADHRLQAPGTYAISVGMGSSVAAPTAWSDECTLVVNEPVGANRAVWEKMVAKSGGRPWGTYDWEGSSLREEVVVNHPESDYAQYLVGFWYSRLPDWLARREIGLRGPQRDFILLDEAKAVAGSWVGVLMDGGNVTDAKRVVDQARELLQPLESSEHVYVSHVAKLRAAQLPEEKEIAEFAKSLRQPSPRANSRIEPFVDCVGVLENESFVAWFGYKSEFSHPFQLPNTTGQNKFEPKPHERGQPNEFLPGHHSRVFSTAFDGEPITWFIRGEKATAAKDSTRCD